MFVAKSVGLHQNQFLRPLFSSSLRRVLLSAGSQNFKLTTTLTFSSSEKVVSLTNLLTAASDVNFQFCGSSVSSQISKMGRTGKKRKQVSFSLGLGQG